MKNRFKRYMLYLFIQYVPGANKIAKQEAKTLARYIFDNFSETDRVVILTEMKHHLIEFMSNQIQEKEIELRKQSEEIESLTKTLNKLKLR